MNDFLQTLPVGEILSTIITLVLIPLLIVGTNAIVDFLKTKTKNEKLDKYLDKANDAIITAVQDIMQTFVTTIKNNGEWTEESGQEALTMAKLKAIELMGAAAYTALPELVGDVEVWLIAKIEAATRAEKLKEKACKVTDGSTTETVTTTTTTDTEVNE